MRSFRTAKHRSSLRHRKQLALRRAAFFVAVLLVTAAAFAGGFFWRYDREARSPVVVRHAERGGAANSEALRLLDEAVRARYEKRWQVAMDALAEARRIDPSTKGVDTMAGEIALEQNDATTLRQAAREALGRGENAASANLLLALEAWMQRGASGVFASADSAKRYLDAAAESQPSSAPVFFFLGELNRLLGNNVEACRSLQSALHRFNPWHSSAVLSAKVVLASNEARHPVAIAPIDTTLWGRAVASASQAHKVQGSAPLQALASYSSQPALRALASDPGFDSLAARLTPASAVPSPAPIGP